jgi:hypothetical protein
MKMHHVGWILLGIIVIFVLSRYSQFQTVLLGSAKRLSMGTQGLLGNEKATGSGY